MNTNPIHHKITDYFNPFDHSFHAKDDFKKMGVTKKLLVVAGTALASVATLGIASFASFRFLTKRLYQSDSSFPKNTHKIATQRLNPVKVARQKEYREKILSNVEKEFGVELSKTVEDANKSLIDTGVVVPGEGDGFFAIAHSLAVESKLEKALKSTPFVLMVDPNIVPKNKFEQTQLEKVTEFLGNQKIDLSKDQNNRLMKAFPDTNNKEARKMASFAINMTRYQILSRVIETPLSIQLFERGYGVEKIGNPIEIPYNGNMEGAKKIAIATHPIGDDLSEDIKEFSINRRY